MSNENLKHLTLDASTYLYCTEQSTGVPTKRIQKSPKLRKVIGWYTPERLHRNDKEKCKSNCDLYRQNEHMGTLWDGFTMAISASLHFSLLTLTLSDSRYSTTTNNSFYWAHILPLFNWRKANRISFYHLSPLSPSPRFGLLVPLFQWDFPHAYSMYKPSDIIIFHLEYRGSNFS